jgi:Calpain family cysteine protease
MSAHAYTLIEATQVEVDDGSTEKLLKIRNPWGQFEWSGDWSDNSSKWTE